MQSGYLAKYQPTGQANVYAQHTREANFSVAAVPPPYCCQNFSCAHPALGQAYACYNGHSMAHNGCRQYKFGEVVHKKKNGIFVVTYATNTIKNLTAVPGARASEFTRNYFVPNVEQLKVAALMSFDVKELKVYDQVEDGSGMWNAVTIYDYTGALVQTLARDSKGKIALPIKTWLKYAGHVTLDSPNQIGQTKAS